MTRILAAACIVLALASMYLVTKNTRQAATIMKVSDQLKLEQQETKRLTAQLQAQHELAIQAAELDREHTQALSEAQAENRRLAAAVSAGNQRLRVQATCVPATTSATRVDDGATAELDAYARQDYYAIRQQITQTEAALAGLQDWVSNFCTPKGVTQ